MKTKNLLLIAGLFCCVFFSRQATAQVTGLTVEFGDSLSSFCKIPSTRIMAIYLTPKGAPKSTDSATIYVNFDDGSDTTFKLGFGPGMSYAGINHTYTFAGTFGARVIASMPSGVADTFDGTPRTLTNLCGTLNGYLYVDDDKDCVKDATEKGIFWTPVIAINTVTKDTSTIAWTNDSGYYSADLLPGSYTLMAGIYNKGYGVVTDSNVTPTCPSSGTHSLTISTGGSYTKDFANECKTITAYDASSYISSRGFIPGDSTYINVWAGNWVWYFHYTCASLSSTITLTLDPKLTYLSSMSGMAPTSVSGSTISWTLSSTKDVVRFLSAIWVKVPTTATIGDTIRLSTYIAPTAYTDPNLSNNTCNYKRAVTSSYDPNMKEVYPTGSGAPGFIRNDEKLTYTIHFQNTGTAPAKNITVSDDIDANLDLSTLHLLSTSHNASLHVDGRTVKFRFANINLPDSGTNMNASMGMIVYGIMPKKGLKPGTAMRNTAEIYFDYNAPIVTNTTVNTTNIPTLIETVTARNIEAKIFPNPANNSVNISMEKADHFSVTVMDMLGKIVAAQSTDNGTIILPTQSLVGGLYLLNIKDAAGNELNTKVVVKH